MGIENSIWEFYENSTESDASALVRLQKQVDMWAITNLYAPLKLKEVKDIKKSYKKDVKSVGDDAKNAIENFADILSDSIKGAYSNKVRATMKDKAKEYDSL